MSAPSAVDVINETHAREIAAVKSHFEAELKEQIFRVEETKKKELQHVQEVLASEIAKSSQLEIMSEQLRKQLEELRGRDLVEEISNLKATIANISLKLAEEISKNHTLTQEVERLRALSGDFSVLQQRAAQKSANIERINITHTEKRQEKSGNKKYTAFCCEVSTYGGERWVVARRYKHFEILNTQLIRAFGEPRIPRFPPKRGVFKGNMTKEEHVEKRKQALQAYLNALISEKELSEGSAILASFFRRDD